MGFEIKTFKEEYENLKRQIEEYQDFWEWYECKYDKTKADLFDEYDSERVAENNPTSQEQLATPEVMDCSTCKHREVSKYVEPCYGCRDNDGYDHYASAIVS